MFKKIKRMMQKKRRLESLQKRIAERKANEPRVYAYREAASSYSAVLSGRCEGPWSKIVVSKPPDVKYHHGRDLIGPFRSEIDCEEFCDRQNLAECQNVFSFYSPQTLPEKNKI